jgi:hypothetical protein
MTSKYTHRIDTMDGPIEVESDVPQIPIRHRTQEGLEEERARLYPTEDKASYLQYPCEDDIFATQLYYFLYFR